MLKIGEFAVTGQVSIQTLRRYDKLGLLIPRFIDPETGYRYYLIDQLPRLKRIQALRSLGFKLQEIPALLDATLDDLHRALWEKQRETLRGIEAQVQQLHRVQAQLEHIDRESSAMPFDLVPTQIQAESCLLMQHSGCTGHETMSDFFWEVVNALQAMGIWVRDVRDLFHQHPSFARLGHAPGGIRRDCLFMTEESAYAYLPTFSFGTLQPAHLGAAPQAVSTLIQGDIAQSLEANRCFVWWAERNGYTLAGPVYYNYIRVVDGDAAHPANLTEIVYPVQR